MNRRGLLWAVIGLLYGVVLVGTVTYYGATRADSIFGGCPDYFVCPVGQHAVNTGLLGCICRRDDPPPATPMPCPIPRVEPRCPRDGGER